MGFDVLQMAVGGLPLVGGIVVWAIRLEGKIKGQAREIELTNKRLDILAIKHDELDSKIVQELTKLREGLARIEGYLQRAKE